MSASRRVPAIMVQGTASGVGKSWLCAALCRALARRGLSVAPFKAQNMSNNAAPARDLEGGWGEIGRAQAAQALACGREPHVDMNPILLKPRSEVGAEVVVHGRPVATLHAQDYRARREVWWQAVGASYARLSQTAEIVVIEGAGSPAEINLRAGDLVNMAMAHHADAAVLLVGDIDRGGVFASLYGTLSLLPPEDRARVAGLVINRFRGDVSLLAPALPGFGARVGVPVRGVLPFAPHIHIDEEDSQDIRSGAGLLDVAVIRLPTAANVTDLSLLGREPNVGIRYETEPARVGTPDLLVLPGSRDTLADLAWSEKRGLAPVIRACAARGVPVLGLCGGYQMLGRRLGDAAGLDLLPVSTDYAPQKEVRPTRGRTLGGWLLPAGLPVEGYEIHYGRTAGRQALVDLELGPDGAVAGLVAGTYLHGLLDSAPVREALVRALWSRRGLDTPPPTPERTREAHLDAAADLVEAHLDLKDLPP